MNDPLVIAGREFNSRLLMGSGGYPNQQVMLELVAGGTAGAGNHGDKAHQPGELLREF